MKRFLILLAFFVSSSLAVSAQSPAFRTASAMDVYYAALRELDAAYVDTVDAEKLVKRGLQAMLNSLDPYTEYIEEANSEDIELMTTGAYGGIGAVIKKKDSCGVMISEPYIGSPAVKYGLEPGDIILAIDGEDVIPLSPTECSNRMKGVPGTDVRFTVIKGKSGDTLDIVVTRERVHISDVVYSGILRDSIGYIKISGFTQGGAKDVRAAYEKLAADGRMKRLVLDLRGNGGGLMDEAIGIVSLFVPYGSEVVSSKGRIEGMSKVYRTSEAPLDTLIPMMVMVNSGSASSSEIVAGALQDLDRALIAGKRTYGKGLVQTIREVGYNDRIKLTTAKYYTPSGRCVQAIDYSNRNEDGSVGAIPDSLKKAFYTRSGRTVYDGGGITPDLDVDDVLYSRVSASLVMNDIIGEYAIEYYRLHDSIASPSEFRLSDEEYEDFVRFAEKKDFDFRTGSAVQLEQLLKTARNEGLYDIYRTQLDALSDIVSADKRSVLELKKDEISQILEEEIVIRYYYRPGGTESFLRNDNQLVKALDGFKNGSRL